MTSLLQRFLEVEPLRSKMTFRLQEPEAPFQNATSRDWQKAFNPQRELGAFCSGVKRECIFLKRKVSGVTLPCSTSWHTTRPGVQSLQRRLGRAQHHHIKEDVDALLHKRGILFTGFLLKLGRRLFLLAVAVLLHLLA